MDVTAVVCIVDSMETLSDDPAEEGVVSELLSSVGVEVEAIVVVSEDEIVG